MSTEEQIAAEVWAVLDALIHPHEERLPGDVTVAEIAEHYGVSGEHARSYIKRLIGEGKLREVVIGRHKNGRPAVVYRIVSVETVK